MHPGTLSRAVVERQQLPIAQTRPGDRHFMDSSQIAHNMKMKLRVQVQHEDEVEITSTTDKEEETNKPLTRVGLQFTTL